MQRAASILTSLLRHSALAGALFLLIGASPAWPAPEEVLSAEEKESLQQAKDPEQQLKLWLRIADSRLKDIVLYTRELDKANSAKAVTGFRAAVASADDRVAKEQGGKNHKKLLLQLHKAVKKYNFTLLQALDKAAEEFRQYIQSAFEASQRVQDAAEIQMAHFQ
ncbi:MAG: hypothetical protein FJW26_19615 [Acidimicrobiia bacterium]|nr:hypothetical protein [Acidimicrobiia bacterium]